MARAIHPLLSALTFTHIWRKEVMGWESGGERDGTAPSGMGSGAVWTGSAGRESAHTAGGDDRVCDGGQSAGILARAPSERGGPDGGVSGAGCGRRQPYDPAEAPLGADARRGTRA